MIQLAGLDVIATSVAGFATCIEVPAYRLAFDMGTCPRTAVNRPTVLFTHAHVDHMGCVVSHAATRAMLGMSPPAYVIPRENEGAFRDLFDAWRRLDGSRLLHTVTAIGPGETVPVGSGRFARAFRSPHRVACQGYVITSVKQKLRSELAKLPDDEIRRLRVEEGVEVTERVEVPELVFTGDTRADVLDAEPLVGAARRLICEVTFVDDRVSVAQARAAGHVHLHDLAERAHLLKNEALLFTHFSARYSAAQIEQSVRDALPDELFSRVTLLVGEHA